MHEKALEALLFVSGEPLTLREIAKYLAIDKKEVGETIAALEQSLSGRGLCVLRHDDSIALATAPDVTDIAGSIAKERLEGSLTRTQLETLAIILWKGKVSRSSIDYIRGVNSSFALRTLLIRGLIERTQDTKDARIYFYAPTVDLFKYLGITSIKDMPEFANLDPHLKEYE